MKKELDERMMDLLADQALFGLSEEELRELERFGSNDDSLNAAQSLELTAAQISTIGIEKDAEMPEHLFKKILADSKHLVAAEQNVFTAPRRRIGSETASSGSAWSWLAWAIAAAACVALAVNVFTTRQANIDVAGGTKPTPTPAIEEKLTPAQMRQRLIDTEQALARAEWTKGSVKETEGISGDVVWSDAKQAGYMRISGLPVNDKTKQTYQLWIFDETQSEKTPIDGGVFDVSETGEVIIPIDAKLNAKNPKAFAITIEKPGGVVVSERKQVVGLATVKPSQT
jgi:anti-sigma-K factor RskA